MNSSNQTDVGWSWFQRPWWAVRSFAHALWPARFSLFVGVIGACAFLGVQQGTEVLRALGEVGSGQAGGARTQQVVCFFSALLIWSLNAWYWPRVLLNFRFPGTPARGADPQLESAQATLRKWGPRLLGLVPPVSVAAAFLVYAPRGYATNTLSSPRHTLLLHGVAAALLAGALLLFFHLRRGLLRSDARRGASEAARQRRGGRSYYERVSELWDDRPARNAVLGFLLLALVLLMIFWVSPVESGLWLGSGAILCLAASSWVCFGSLVVLASGLLRLPFIALLLLLSIYEKEMR